MQHELREGRREADADNSLAGGNGATDATDATDAVPDIRPPDDSVAREVAADMGPYGRERLDIRPPVVRMYVRSQVWLIRALQSLGVISGPEEYAERMAAGFRHLVAVAIHAYRKHPLRRLPADVGHIGATVRAIGQNVRAHKGHKA